VANQYCSFSVVLPNLQEVEEAWLREQLTKIYVFGEQEYLEDEVPDNLYFEDADWQGLRVFRDVDDGDETEHDADFNHAFLDDATGERGNGWGRHLWLFAEENGNPANVAWLVHKFLARFRHRESWELSYAVTCSKMVVDAFGGGALFVTAEAIQGTDDYLAQLRDQFRNQQSEATA
jgi:hypothetical protein